MLWMNGALEASWAGRRSGPECVVQSELSLSLSPSLFLLYLHHLRWLVIILSFLAVAASAADLSAARAQVVDGTARCFALCFSRASLRHRLRSSSRAYREA